MNNTEEKPKSSDYDLYSTERFRALREKKQLERTKRKENKAKKRFVFFASTALVLAAALVCVKVITARQEKSVIHEKTVTAAAQTEDTQSAKNKNPYKKISFSIADNEKRYEEYKKKHPEYDYEEVVWRVNSNLDKPLYEYDVPASGYDDPYIIVNKYYTVANDYRPPDLVNTDGHLMRKDTAEAYKKLRDAARAEGLTIYAVSAYRSVDYQKNLYNSYLAEDDKANVDRYSARAGHSEHHTGMAIDLYGSIEGLRNFEKTPEYPWLKKNAYKYGFIIRYMAETEEITGYESEPWHIRYIGIDASTDMHDKNILTFEEYHARYLENNKGD